MLIQLKNAEFGKNEKTNIVIFLIENNILKKKSSKILILFLLFIIIFSKNKPKKNIDNNLNLKRNFTKPKIKLYSTKNSTKNKSNQYYVHLAVNMDNKYIYPFIVYLTSLLHNKANSTFYIIHVLTGNGIINSTFEKINRTIEAFGKYSSNVSYYNLGNQFNRAQTNNYISIAAYYRISLPSLLPNVDKVIYTDTDIINFKDLSEMYNIEFKGKMYFCGTLDYIGHLEELRKLGIFTDKYMNTGVMLMNLKAMRNDSIEEKIRNFVYSHFLNHHEQTAINAVCYNNIQILSYKYASFAFSSKEKLNYFNNNQSKLYRYNESELNQSFYDPTLLHFPGYVKPWEKKCSNMKRVYWWYYAKKSIYFQEILDYYGFMKEEIEELLKNITKI